MTNGTQRKKAVTMVPCLRASLHQPLALDHLRQPSPYGGLELCHLLSEACEPLLSTFSKFVSVGRCVKLGVGAIHR